MRQLISILLLTVSITTSAGKVWITSSPNWTPLSSATLRAWGDCSDGTKVSHSGTTLTGVTDKSTNAYSWSGTGTYASNVVNGYSGCQFGSSDKLTGTTGADITAGTICSLVYATSLAQFNAVFSNTNGTAITLEVGAGANKFDLWFSGVGATAATGNGSLTTNTWFRVCAAYDQSGPAGTVYINGVSAATTTQASGFFKMTSYNVSKDGGGNFFGWVGYIQEWIIDTAVGGTLVTKVDTYWKNKYGL